MHAGERIVEGTLRQAPALIDAVDSVDHGLCHFAGIVGWDEFNGGRINASATGYKLKAYALVGRNPEGVPQLGEQKS